MKKLPMIIKKRQKLGEKYDKAFSKCKYIIPPHIPEGYAHNRQTYIVRLSKNAKLSRDEFMQKLLNKRIATRRGVMASHMEPAYKKLTGKVNLPETEKAERETIAIPLYSQMTKDEQDYVIENIIKYDK